MVGGAEEMVLNLVTPSAASLSSRRWCCIHHAGPIGDEIRRTGVPFTCARFEPGLATAARRAEAARLPASGAAEIVHTFLLTGSLYGRFAAMMAGVPIVIGTEVNIYENKRAIARALRAVADGVAPMR